MVDMDYRIGATQAIRTWGKMISTESEGPGFNFQQPRQAQFIDRYRSFLNNPSEETFRELWCDDAVVEHDNPNADILLQSFTGGADDFADFLRTFKEAEKYDPSWSDQLIWERALWELYSRLSPEEAAIITRKAEEGLAVFGISASGSYRDRIAVFQEFADWYQTTVGHPTAGTDHEVPVSVELEELFGAAATLSPRDLSAQLRGPYGPFYRFLYGGSEGMSGRTKKVALVDESEIVYAYAWGKKHNAYEREDQPEFWGGTYWESWKQQYAEYINNQVRSEFVLDDLDPCEIEPLFEDLTDEDAADLSRSVTKFIMGSQWGKYAWDDVVEHFQSAPEEASSLLSLFFDDTVNAITRLRAFREHTIHITDQPSRGPGSLQRMATSLLMFTELEDQLGLPSQRTAGFLENKSTLPEFKNGFRPDQYGVIIPPFRRLQKSIQQACDELGVDETATMLDVHNIVWIYNGGENEPRESELPPEALRSP
ncbi:hypothetical protein [Natranaeroarchaeum sulfidigenes]|nr:hypothetical protein [Natranaeroarchaeum sulfidigenes]